MSVKIIHSLELMDIEFNCMNPYIFNRKFVYKDKYKEGYFVYEVKFTIYDDIYIENLQQTFKKNNGWYFLQCP